MIADLENNVVKGIFLLTAIYKNKMAQSFEPKNIKERMKKGRRNTSICSI